MLETLPKRSERRPPRRRRTGLVVLVAFFLALALLAAAGAGFYSWATGASGPRRAITVKVEPGMTGADVATLLAGSHVIRSELAFRLFERFHGRSAGFTAGVYRLTTNMTVAQAFAAMARGPSGSLVTSVSVTLPEGLTIRQTAGRVGSDLGFGARAFLTATRAGGWSLPPYLPKARAARSLEGFLFPDTYTFDRGAAPKTVIARLLSEFRQQAANLPWKNARRLGVTPYQVVIIASLIEREARYQVDRVRVARVIYNRLKLGMRLQIDATIEYALPHYRRVLTQADLHLKSPYNTYLHTGLPPTPIASPGRASLLAALRPATGNWLFYLVTKKDGHESFTASYAQFQQWVAQQSAG